MSKLPETGSSLVGYLGRQKRSALRQAQSSPFVRSGITPTAEGAASIASLSNVDNTADSAKPVSTAQAAAILAIKPTTRFKGSLLSSVAVAGGANIAFATLDDPASGWNSTSHYWICPVAGTYVLMGSIKQNSAGVASMSINIHKNGTTAIAGPNCAAVAYGGGTATGYLRLAIGDTVSMQCGTSYTTQSDSPADNNYLELVQVQF